MYPYDYFALDIETHFAICLNSDVVPAPCDDVIEQMTPVAEAATDISCTGFTAHWAEETEATGYYLDVSTVNTFASFVAGYNNLNVGNVTEYAVTGLVGGTYYYRVRSYDDIATSASSNTVTATILPCWYLPSHLELNAMCDNLYALGVGGFAADKYWSSTERDADTAFCHNFFVDVIDFTSKDVTYHVRACRNFTAVAGAYALRDTGPLGGLIFYIDGTTYYEAAPSDQSSAHTWSNIIHVAIGTTSTAIGEGHNNTDEIIAQAGHTDSAAKLCEDTV